MTKNQPTERRPLLSLVVTGRNDSYMGDFKWRLQAAANLNARAAASIGREHDLEIIVADWNSDVPLAEEIPLLPEAQRITRFVYTPKEIAEGVQKDTTFPDSIVINTGIRRARGEFIAMTGSDVVYPAAALRNLFSILEGGYRGLPVRDAILTACRRHIPTPQVNRRHPLPDLEGYISRNACFFPVETGAPGHAAPTSMIMMHRDLWFQCQGFDERLIYWGFNDIDLTIRMTQKYPFIHTDHYGVIILHLEHWDKKREYKTETFFRKLNPADNLTPSFAANDENWGLGQHELPIHKSSQKAEITPPPAPGSIEGWNLSLQKIAEEIMSNEMQTAVRNHMQAFNNVPISNSEGPALLGLAWYATRKSPCRFVEVGFRYPHAATLVTRSSPGAEIYAVVNWERREIDDPIFYTRGDTSLIFFVSNSLRQMGHWAYTQYVGGDPATAVKRLIASAVGPFNLDLVFMRANRDDSPTQAAELAKHLVPGGAMVISASTPSLYQSTVDAVRLQFPMFACINFGDGINGMILAVKPAT